MRERLSLKISSGSLIPYRSDEIVASISGRIPVTRLRQAKKQSPSPLSQQWQQNNQRGATSHFAHVQTIGNPSDFPLSATLPMRLSLLPHHPWPRPTHYAALFCPPQVRGSELARPSGPHSQAKSGPPSERPKKQGSEFSARPCLYMKGWGQLLEAHLLTAGST